MIYEKKGEDNFMWFSKNNKKGFSLPFAIGVTCVLVMLSASLIFIASNSIANTSTDVSGRQAYLNVKSALDYAKSYYSGIKNFDVMGTEMPGTSGQKRFEYMSMNDVGGTTNEGAKITQNDTLSKSDNTTTYVYVEYTKAEGSNPATLMLSAYSRYSDAFGRKSKTAHLTVTYNVDNSGGSVGRITVMKKRSDKTSGSTADSVTLKVKKLPGQSWALAPYVWTYEDKKGIYTGKKHYESYELPDPSVDDMNYNEHIAERGGSQIGDVSGTLSEPGGRWIINNSDGLKNGPSATAVSEGGEWYSNKFYTNNRDVHYFSAILSRRGAQLVWNESSKNRQTTEMFHLWYLDPSDKNIYFEFLKEDFYYYTNNDWDGKTNLEDTVLVYVKNPRTTVHVNFVNGDEESTVPSISTPQISSITDSSGGTLTGQSYLHSGNKYTGGIALAYEGCGWWAANIETNGGVTINIPYNGAERPVYIGSFTEKEAWVIYDNASGTLTCYSNEQAACDAAGISNSAYVTIHAKGFNNSNEVHTKLSYKDVAITTSDDRVTLMQKINEADAIEPDDFDDASFAALTAAVSEGKSIYNDLDYISRAPGPKNSEKLIQARDGYTVGGVTYIGYKKATENIQTAIENLKIRTLDPEKYAELNDLIGQAEAIAGSKATYDYDKIVEMTAGPVATAKTALADSTCTNSRAQDCIDELKEAIENMNNLYKLDKSVIEPLISESEEIIKDTNYDLDARNTLNEGKLKEAHELMAKDQIKQSEITTMITELTEALNIVKATYRTPLDLSALDNAITNAKAFRDGFIAADSNYTDEGLDTLKNEIEAAETLRLNTSATQDQINEETDKLARVTSDFIIYKPGCAYDTLASEGKIQVNVVSNVQFDIKAINLTTGATAVIPFAEIPLDVASGMYTTTLDKTAYDAVVFEYTYAEGTTTKTYQSENIKFSDYADGNLFAQLNGSADDFSVALGKVTTLLFYKKSGVFAAPTVTVNGAALTLASEDDVYDRVKFVYADGMNVRVESGDNSTEFTAQAGQFIVHRNGPVAVTSVHPFHDTGSGSKPAASKTSWQPVSLNDSIQLMNYDDTVVGLDSVVFDIPIPEGKSALIIDMSYSKNRENFMPVDVAPYVFTFNKMAHGSGNIKLVVGADNPGTQMIRFKETNFFYVLFDNTARYFNINYVTDFSNPSSPTTELFRALSSYPDGDMPFTSSAPGAGSINKYYLLGWVNPSTHAPTTDYKNGAYELMTSNGTPVLSVPKIEVDDLLGTDIDMPFVGGSKVRITNRPYAEVYGSGTKADENGWKLNDSNFKYGGFVQGKNCHGRVGSSKLSPYYDWCDIKIPVAKSATYSFAVKGMNNKNSSTSNISTTTITNATGDVWVTLNSEALTGGKYSDVSIYSFDPDTNVIGDTTRVYFALPSGWDSSSLTASYVGVGVSASVAMDHTLASESTYHYADIDKTTPFVTFSVVDDTGTSRIFKTSLQGADKVLFNPTLDNENIEGGKGDWTSFSSNQEKLKDALITAQGMYYGNTLIQKYNDDGLSASQESSNYKYAEGLKNAYKDFSTVGDGAGDDSIKVSDVMALADTTAGVKYDDVKAVVDAYSNLYGAMSEARTFISVPVSGGGAGVYMEYKNRADKKTTYTTASIENIRRVLEKAEGVYASGAGAGEVNAAASELRTAIASKVEETRGAIALLLYDSQDKIKASSVIKVFYDGCPAAGVDVTDVNPENFPIVFVDANKTYTDPVTHTSVKCIENVYFTVNGVKEGATAARILDNKQYVMMDTAVDPEWVENASVKYVEIEFDELTQSSGDPMVYELEDYDGDGKKDMMVVYFEKNTTIKRTGKTPYVVKAGAYYFYHDKTPVVSDKVDLFSDEVQTYLTDPQNYGEIAGAATSDSLGWTNSGVIKKTGTYSCTSGDVNFVATGGMLSTSYATRLYSVNNGSIYFRWDSANDLVVGKDVTFSARVPADPTAKDPTTKKYVPSITFATCGTVKSTKVSPKLYFMANNSTSDKMVVTFKTDTEVVYRDSTGDKKFVIREGTYLIKKKNASDKYIANLFDKTYWKSREYVKSLSDSTVVKNTSGGNIEFSGGTYS